MWALITGATGGIGRDAALSLAGRGMRVIATGRSRDKLGGLAEEARARGLSLSTAHLDVADAASVEAAAREVDRITSGYGVDVLINNAGYGEMGPLELMDAARVTRMFETNVVGLARVTRAFLPAMRERGRGRVINVSSLLGRMTIATHGVYAATKHAVEAISDALRREMAPHGVEVIVIEPGAIATGFDDVAFGALTELRDEPDWAPVLAHVRSLASTNQRLAAAPSVVSDAIHEAIVARAPAPRVAVPFFAQAQLALTRATPRALAEPILRTAFGIRGATAAPPATATRRALITGAAGGIGHATARQLAKAGYRVIATDVDRAALARVARDAKEQRLAIETRVMDVTDASSVLAAARELGTLDVVINNAGYAEVGPIELVGDDAWRRQLAVNVYGPLNVTRAFLPAMRRARRGRVVNVSSIVGVLAFPFLGVYSASKHALEALTDAMRLELGAFGVGVAAVQPAFIRSGFTATAKATLARYDLASSPYAKVAGRMDTILDRLDRLGGEPDDVARAVRRALSDPGPAARYRTPLSAMLAARLAPLVPARASDRALARFFGA